VLVINSGSLPGAAREQEAIAHLFPHTRVVDPKAVKWTRVRSLLEESDALHYIGHAKLIQGAVSLVFDGDRSFVRGQDFQPQFLKKTRLAVLAACSSGTADDDGLLDTESLLHTFLSAGVPEIIVSRWNVNSEATSQLMQSFYTHMRQGFDAAQSISAAKREALASNHHPYFWASFELVGRAN